MNKNARIQMADFKKLMIAVVEKSTDKNIFDVIFAKLDTDCGSSIPVKDFQALLQGEENH